MEDINKLIENAMPELRKHSVIVGRKYSIDHASILNRAVIRAIEKKHTFDGEFFNAWVKKIMTNIAIDIDRKNRRTINKNTSISNKNEIAKKSKLETNEKVESEQKEEQIYQLVASIRKLNKNCQEILREYLSGSDVSSQKDLAKSLGIPMGTVSSRFQRCLIRLKNIVMKLPEFNPD